MRTVQSYLSLLLPIRVGWKFKNSKLSVKREKLLMRKMPYLFIVRCIVSEMRNVQLKVEYGDREAKGKRRPVFSFDINEKTFDLFFNGSQGYRAHFYKSIGCGLIANKSVIRLLRNKLLSSTNFYKSELTREQVKKSLSNTSSKIWICEKISSLNLRSIVPDEIQYLDIPEWTEAMYDTVAKYSQHESVDPLKDLALWGVQTPEGYRLKVFGAWLGENNEEFIVPSKVKRAEHIHLYGFS